MKLVPIDAPVADLDIVGVLEEALAEAKLGNLTGIVLLKSYAATHRWENVIAGSAIANDFASLNLHVDLIKRTIMAMVPAASVEKGGG